MGESRYVGPVVILGPWKVHIALYKGKKVKGEDVGEPGRGSEEGAGGGTLHRYPAPRPWPS